ncbi:MAG: rod shape-determining protein RodA [Campylobacterales bacterium]|nr:rod shape-determining protein RodA [Campylobacterales bacterium]
MSFLDRRVIDHFDMPLMFMILPIVGASLFLVGEVSDKLLNKQLIYTTVAMIIFVVVFFFPIRRFTWLIPFAYWINIVLLILVEFIGISKLGAQRWLEIPIVNMTIQPSELMKPAFILMLGYLIERNPPPRDGYDWLDFFKISFFIVLPFVLIAKEPDLGTALIILLVGGAVLLAVGVNKKIWFTLIVLTGLSSGFIYENLHAYQKKRIHDFIAEKPSYHVQQSIIAIGSGGVIGQSKEDATQTQLRFLPIATSDFIFAYYVERFGFIGALGLLILYATLILHLLSLTGRVKGDYLASVTIVAVSVMIFLYMSVNIAMTMGLAPVVGVPLPIFSHGGSSFVNFIVLFAIIENLLAFRFNFIYSNDLKTVAS